MEVNNSNFAERDNNGIIIYKFKPSIELERIDCNCNNCTSFVRDIQKTKDSNKNEQVVEFKVHHGHCLYFNKDVAEIANITLVDTQKCFIHRRDAL